MKMLEPKVGDIIVVHGIVNEIYGSKTKVIRARAVDGHQSMFSVYPDEVREVIPAAIKVGDTVRIDSLDRPFEVLFIYDKWALVKFKLDNTSYPFTITLKRCTRIEHEDA